jgi:hypothetical protein
VLAFAFLLFVAEAAGFVAVLALREVVAAAPVCFFAVLSEDCPVTGVTIIRAASRPARHCARIGAGKGKIAALIVSL